jgi:hypothetical protein
MTRQLVAVPGSPEHSPPAQPVPVQPVPAGWRRRWRQALGAAAVLAAIVAATGCEPLDVPTATQSSAPVAPLASAPASAAGASAELATIPVRSIPGRDPSYRREAFGDAWSDAGTGIAGARNGCDTRNDILRRDARPGTLRFKAGSHDCKVTGGTWVSPYTGATLTRTAQIDIDHIVPLSRAWSSGAKTWDAARRLNFANDPDNLLAADRSSNRSKGDLGPSAWRPVRALQCAYAVKYIHSAKKYQLPLSPPDVSALRQMLATCPATR